MPRLPLPLLFQNPLFWFLAVSAYTVLYFFAGHEGFYFGDDYSYSLYAHQILNGGFHFDDYSFCHRFMVFVPTAFFYWLGGMNIYITTLWPLLCTLGTLYLLYRTFRNDHPVAASWAVVLVGLFFFQLLSVNYLYPDNILLFFATATLIVLYKARNPFKRVQQEVIWGAFFAFLNLLAFLTKETIVYALPFYACLFLFHALHRKNLRFWAVAALTGVVLLAGYFLLYKLFSGHALQRLYDIAATNTEETRQAYLDTRSATLLPRLTYLPFLFFIGSGLAIPLAFAALSFFKAPKLFQLHNPHSFWIVAMLSMLLPIWFASATVDFYKPMPLLPRMFYPLLPAFCLTAGLAVERAWAQRLVFLFLSLVFGVSIFLAGGDVWIIYAPLALFFAGALLFKKTIPSWLALLAVAAVLCIRPTYFMLKPTVSYYFEQKEIVDQRLMHSKGNHVVLTDSVMFRRHPFFYGFQVPENYNFKDYRNYTPSSDHKADTVFLLINNGVLEHPELMMPIKERDILPLFPQAQLLQQKGKVKLYFLPKR